MKTYDELAADLIATHGADTALCDIADKHFAFGSDFDAFLKSAGYNETPRHVINGMNGWGLTVGELIDRERPAPPLPNRAEILDSPAAVLAVEDAEAELEKPYHVDFTQFGNGLTLDTFASEAEARAFAEKCLRENQGHPDFQRGEARWNVRRAEADYVSYDVAEYRAAAEDAE